MPDKVKDLQREGLSVAEACHVAGFGRNKLYEAMQSGALPARKLGRRVIILRDDLLDYMTSLPAFENRAA